MTKRLTWFFVEAAAQGVTASLNELLSCPDLPNAEEDPLAAIEALCHEASDHGVLLIPHPTSVRDFTTEIVLLRRNENDAQQIGDKVRQKYLIGEMPNVEYKSTLWLDVDRKKNDLNATALDLRSIKIANSSMKTICGFLNESGGHLIVGVSDDTEIFGLESEFDVTSSNDQTIDGWLQVLRATVEQFFHDPKEILNHLQIEIGLIDGKSVCLITVIPRKKLSVCKCKEGRNFQAYSRKATSTDSVGMGQIEDYVINRARRLGSI